MKVDVVVKKICFTTFTILCRNALVVQRVWWKNCFFVIGKKKDVAKRICFTRLRCCAEMFWLYNEFGEKNCWYETGCCCKKKLFYKIHDVVQKCIGCTTSLMRKIVVLQLVFFDFNALASRFRYFVRVILWKHKHENDEDALRFEVFNKGRLCSVFTV